MCKGLIARNIVMNADPVREKVKTRYQKDLGEKEEPRQNGNKTDKSSQVDNTP